ncbi:acyl carrier protein [Streptomyces albus]|uniref:acyl carrier protein n=1 Tax=Streptomyces TaxID=1883 RepID=UPI0003A45264|nr:MULTISPECIES: acyl carrier protein [Streptomyces]KPC95533.1 hypothetical protein ADL27_08610 [Streptomyces sp. NRRL F-6602]MDI6412565.1 acyl carrier protein [Streptomyces albus]QID34512.1 acyl carrier protein [Streptomyces albus]UVN58691.1 acyl carrier protein [Streptomyces albus]
MTNLPQTDVREQIRGFLSRHLSGYDIGDDENLFDTGYVNSLFLLQLVVFVENTLGVEVEDGDLRRDNFCSVSAIDTFVARKQAAAGTPGQP